MDIFDDTIIEIKSWFEERRKIGQTRLFLIAEAGNMDMPPYEEAAGDKPPAGIILKEDTQIELGHPSVGSCCAALATHDSDLVCDGRITLVGPDISETHEEHLAFGQIIIAAVKGGLPGGVSPEETAAIDRTASRMDRIAHSFAQSRGYMIRSIPNLIWARVSKEAARQGFSFRRLGERLVLALKQNCENIHSCEIYFATGNKSDIERLDDIIEIARSKMRKLEELKLGPDGEYACTREQDCGTCSEQVVCDTIRDVIKIRKGDRVITFGQDEVAVRTLE
jgi:CO dehydrogenase/acetyl-CoA synthase beta subunit